MLDDAFADVDALAHVDHIAELIVEIIHASGFGQCQHLRPADARRQRLRLDLIGEPVGIFGGFFTFLAFLLRHNHAEQLRRGFGIAHGAVAALDLDAEVVADLTQAVRRVARKCFAAQAHGAERLALVSVAQVLEGRFDERIIETHVVGHKHGLLGEFDDLAGHLVEFRRVAHHLVRNAREPRDLVGDAAARIYQRLVTLHHLRAVVQHNGDFGNPVTVGMAAGGFYVNDCVQNSVSGCLVVRVRVSATFWRPWIRVSE